MDTFYVYILTNFRNGTLYIGVTNDLRRRIFEHHKGTVEGFTKRYGLKRLVFFEQTESSTAAIGREKQLKKWNRVWKLDLINKFNEDWRDLSGDI